MLIIRKCLGTCSVLVMFEESVASSPCRSKKSAQKLRIMRRSKRKGQGVTNQAIQKEKMSNRILQSPYDDSPEEVDPRDTNQAIQEEKMSNRILQCLYNDSDNSTEEVNPKDTTIGHDSVVTVFKPFGKQRLSRCTARTSSRLLHSTKNSEFQPCLSALESEKNIVPSVGNCEYVITDSELLNCWNEVDEMLTSTPKKRLNLVNSILEDFALSPYTDKPNGNAKFWEYSPEFVLKSKPRITYGSKQVNAVRVDCNKRLDFTSNDECFSDSSFISVQENLSQLGELSTSVIANTTERLCENLLNLSAYYTQTCSSLDKHTPDASSSVDFNEDAETIDMLPTFNNVVSLIQEIISLRETITCSLRKCCSYTSSEDIYGFHEANSDDDAENETTLVYNRCGTTGAALCSRVCSQKQDEDREMIMGVEVKKGNQFDDWADECMEIFAFIKTPPHSCKKELRKPVDDVEQSRGNLCSGFKTASSKQIHISTEAQTKATDKLKNLPESIPKQSVKRNILNATSLQVKQDIGIGDSEIINRTFKCSEINGLHDQPSTSKAALKANKEYVRRNVDCGLIAQQPNKEQIVGMQCPIKGTNSKEEINQKNFLNSTQDSINNSYDPIQKQLLQSDTCTGFQTANGKNIKPTSKSLKSVKMLLNEFQSEQCDENCLVSMKSVINLKQTASDTKVMNDKENSVLWSEGDDLADVIFSEWSLEELLKSQCSQKKMAEHIETKTCEVECGSQPTALESNTSLNTEIGSFQTAGGKSASISEKGKQIAEGLLRKIKDGSDTNDLLDIKNSIQKKNNKTVLAPKPKPPQNDSSLGFKTIATYAETAGSSTKAEYEDLHTEFGGFQTAGGTKISISKKGKQIAESLLQKIISDSDTNDLLDIKNSIQKKNNKTVLASKPITPQKDQSLGRKTIPTYEETSDSCTKSEYKHLNVSKTYQNRTTNTFTELSVKSPLNVSVANSIIARKNLLSLKRNRKRCGILSPAREANANGLTGIIQEFPREHANTPNKCSDTANVVQTLSTPNLYFNASKCSTPRLDLGIISSNNNKSISDTHSNIKCNSPNPPVNDRIARPRLYEEAQPISPILTNLQSNCRIRGLKRPRSMLKKPENI